MGNYTKNGARKFKLDNQKQALKQLNNFSNILENMQSLHKEIENYNGQITESNLDNIANLINLEQRLKLSEDQVKMVTKRFLE